jgi:hypothetical protein
LFVFPFQEFLSFGLIGGREVGFSFLVVARKFVLDAFEALNDAIASSVAMHAFERAAVDGGVLLVAVGPAVVAARSGLALSPLNGLNKVIQVLIRQS